MTTLSNATLAQVPAAVAKPAYDRAALGAGVVHIGPGAFHRAHQAPAFDAILGADPRWGVTAVSLHSAGVRDALAPQDGLYTLALLDQEISYRVIGSIREVLVAPENPAAVLARLAAPETRIVTLTITEKGYCLGADGRLDLSHPDIVADLAATHAPTSALGFLVEALRQRRAAGLAPFAAISCDNLVDNGRKLGAALTALARAEDDELAAWIEAEGVFPCTMVDSITPATDDATRAQVAAVLGLTDAWPIRREAFTQWVVEHDARLPSLDWAGMGATLTDDVSAYERAKLRVLNASHSALAYLGLLRGHETVFDASGDAELAAFVQDFMAKDVAPTLRAPAGFDIPAYCAAVRSRFRNPAIRHLLSQIAWDGSQKLPNRLYPLIEEALGAGRPIARPTRIAAAWLGFLRSKALDETPLTDPLAPLLLQTARACTGEAHHDVGLFLALPQVFPASLAAAAPFREALVKAYAEVLNRP